MTSVHKAIIDRVREAIKPRNDKVSASLCSMSDNEMIGMMFSNYRGRGERASGLRLTNMGLQIMLPYFAHCDMTTPDGRNLVSGEILYLDRNATLPYFIGPGRIVMFETLLGTKIRLWGGDISALIRIESL